MLQNAGRESSPSSCGQGAARDRPRRVPPYGLRDGFSGFIMLWDAKSYNAVTTEEAVVEWAALFGVPRLLVTRKVTSSGLVQHLIPNPRQSRLPGVDRCPRPHSPPLSSQGAVPLTYRLNLFLFFCFLFFFCFSLLTYSLCGANIASDFGHLGITVLFGN